MKSLLIFLLTPLAAAKALTHGSRDPGDAAILPRQAANVSSPSAVQPVFTFNQLWDFNKKFLDNFIYPANVKEAEAINSTLLAEDVQGRVDITRTFNGRELNTEYLFGLFANLAAAKPGAISLLGVPLSYDILHFAANQNVASALTRFASPIHRFPLVQNPRKVEKLTREMWSLRFQFNFTALNLIIPVEIDAWNTYNAKGQITQYDATFRHWSWTVDYLQAAGKILHTNSIQATITVLTQAIAQSICGTAMTFCNGTNTQYENEEECLGFLTKGIRFGAAYELGKNTLLCRMVHQNMVPYRPDVHCSHVGKTGGGYCNDDKSYVEMASEDYFTNAPFVPYGFQGVG
ncbi:MAG: hypothetical protein Q9201_000681 [Fulgogasparrea decipioides]